MLDFGKIPKKNWSKFSKTSPFRDRVAELRGPSEGLGGGCALLGCTAASRASVEQPIGTSRNSRCKRELVQFEMIQSDWFSILVLDDHADLSFVNATTHQSTSSEGTGRAPLSAEKRNITAWNYKCQRWERRSNIGIKAIIKIVSRNFGNWVFTFDSL